MCRGVVLLSILVTLAASVPARADDTPIIVTYELKKQRHDARLEARNPKAFWIHQILARIEAKARHLSKPPKQPLTVQLAFTVQRDGHLAAKAVSGSSGNAEADAAAIAMVERAQPFPPMPAAMTDADLTFALPVSFR